MNQLHDFGLVCAIAIIAMVLLRGNLPRRTTGNTYGDAGTNVIPAAESQIIELANRTAIPSP